MITCDKMKNEEEGIRNKGRRRGDEQSSKRRRKKKNKV